MLGDCSVGKSSILIKFSEDKFSESVESTVGAAFASKSIFNGEKEITLQIWDTAGQERFHSLSLLYYRETHGAIVVYDITSKASFERAKLWIEEIRENIDNKAQIALVGNKIDKQKRIISTEKGSNFAKGQGLLFFETSAKTGFGVNKIFYEMSKVIEPKPITAYEDYKSDTDNLNLDPNLLNEGSQKTGCC
ncbi:ras and ef-hand domain-containing protein [Anaeramoeba flamelloides]|uniref:Ras and ef-hand domain-containing protein n=1 Tax=Anaeramoeba flamelloides TaxID=1746091 RepID=A0AAV7ZCK6_9EUKA|nr:ras and ef-hand domain-containing protein [Anaeramoeba flamelloides]